MIKNRQTISVSLKTLLFSVSLVFLFSQCNEESPRFLNQGDVALSFTGKVEHSSGINSRALTQEPIDVNYNDFGDTSFFIYMEGKDTNQQEMDKIGVYWVPSGFQGMLEARTGFTALNWFSPGEKHNFWSWTVPWENHTTPSSDDDNDTGGSDTEGIYVPEDTNPVEIVFQDCMVGKSNNGWNNGGVLENLVGATSAQAYDYIDDGEYVPLQFRHLVSKIVLGTFSMVGNSGEIVRTLQANITFMGMPNRAVLFPRPADNADGSTNRPYVAINQNNPYGNSDDDQFSEPAERFSNYDLDYGLTFAINNKTGQQDVFYVCPELDFDKMEFMVEICNEDGTVNPTYGTKGAYFGDFQSVTFTRKGDEDYNDGDGKDTKILHAGEVMTLNMTLYQEGGPGIGITIGKWNTEAGQKAQHHVHPGIYGNIDGEELWNLFTEGDLNEVNNRFVEDLDASPKVVHIYHDVNLPYNDFPVPEGYMIDGMGFTLTLSPNAEGTVNIGPMRDIYITDGENMIYIDKAGNIWIPDSNGEFIKTDSNIGEGDEISLIPSDYNLSSGSGE